MSEPKDSTSPFSMLLADTDGEAPAARPKGGRTQGIGAPQRNDAPRNTQRTDAERSQRTDDDDADAPDACPTDTAATEQSGDNAVGAFAIAASGQSTATREESLLPEDTASDEIAAIDAVPAVVAGTPAAAALEQPVAIDAPPAVAVTPAAGAPTDPGTIESTAAAGVTTAAPASNSAAATPDPAAGAAAPALTQAPQAAETPPAPHASEQTLQTPTTPEAKPPVERSVARESATPTTSTAPPEPAARDAAVSAGTQEPTESKAAPKAPANAETSPQHATRPRGPDASERPPNASAVSDFVQAAHQQTPDGSQLAQLQAGRDFGHAVAATAHATQGADAANPLMSAPVPLASLAVEIAARAQGGNNRFEIRLDPPELGRIDVRLDIDRSGNVTSRLVVEKAETLDVLRRDAHQLERALQDAGLKTSDNGLQFSLRDQAFAERHDRGGDGHRTLIDDPEAPATSGAPMAYGLTLRGGSGVDIRV